MMEIRKVTLAEIHRRGLDALKEALGPVGMVRFLQQFYLGSGNYTQERELWLEGLTVKDIVREINQQYDQVE